MTFCYFKLALLASFLRLFLIFSYKIFLVLIIYLNIFKYLFILLFLDSNSRALYTSHKISNDEDSYMKFQCLLCSYTSCHVTNIKRHVRSHTGERPYKCHICQKSFIQQYNLKRHLSTHKIYQ